MQCSKETIASLFYNVSSSFLLFMLFSYLTSIFLAKILHFFGGNIFSYRDEFVATFCDEEVEDEIEYDSYHSAHVGSREDYSEDHVHHGGFQDDHVTLNEEAYQGEEIKSVVNEEPSIWISPSMEASVPSNEEDENIPSGDFFSKEMMRKGKGVVENGVMEEQEVLLERRRLKVQEENDEVVFGDSCTVGSTSKSSSEWRSSIKDSCTEDPFSSSSRRSCPKWESYTLFQKYDEEMLFLDRISAQKLHETESLRSKQSNIPRSIPDRIVHKFAPKTQRTMDPYNELEAAYVAQICLTWEALNWNYKHFQRLRASRQRLRDSEDDDHGCPAYIAQQFQQFLVLLQRYIENEPYEHGRRPEVYARVRGLSPKLLQAPEYRDWDEEKREEGFSSRIPSDSFLQIMEESISTFMNFLKADKETHYQKIASFFKKSRSRGSADPILLQHLKKQNKKKKTKLKDMKRSGKCGVRKRRLKEEEEMEILMAEIDLKVVSRVLRMKEVNGDQLHWCEDKMSKVKMSDSGKLQRDSLPLFFPAH